MREPVVAGYPVALRLPQSRFRNPRDVIILIGGAALLALLLISVALARGRLLGPGAPVPSVFRTGQPAETLVGLVQVAVCAGAAAVLIAAGLHRRLRLLAGLAVAGAAAAAAVLPIELTFAAAAGALAGLGVRVAAGVPDQRPGSEAIAAELRGPRPDRQAAPGRAREAHAPGSRTRHGWSPGAVRWPGHYCASRLGAHPGDATCSTSRTSLLQLAGADSGPVSNRVQPRKPPDLATPGSRADPKAMPGQSGPSAAEIRAGIRDSPDSGQGCQPPYSVAGTRQQCQSTPSATRL